jgi:hypothetical protein
VGFCVLLLLHAELSLKTGDFCLFDLVQLFLCF